MITLLAALALGSGTTVRTIDYHGWNGAVQLSNGFTEIVFVPQIGRIMRFGARGGRNVLWEKPELAGKTRDLQNPGKDWVNFGGDKLWPAPQDRWGWPPDPEIDAGPYKVKILPGPKILATGTPSKKLGIQFIREISHEKPGLVIIKNTIVNVSKRPVQWSIWEVAQIDSPNDVSIEASKKFESGYYAFKDMAPPPGSVKSVGASRQGLVLTRNPSRNFKIGSDVNPGWAMASHPRSLLEISAVRKLSGEFPDNGCTIEVYSNPDPDSYMEVELLSPVRTLAPGKRYTFVTRWFLHLHNNL